MSKYGSLPRLVRDKTPIKLVTEDDKVPVWHQAVDREEFAAALRGRLIEEFDRLIKPEHFKEIYEEGKYGHLVDFTDLFHLLFKDDAALGLMIRTKAAENGTFSKGIILERVLDRSELK